jgi:hypothetical protein
VNKPEAEAAISRLLKQAKNDEDFGGDESEEGDLLPGKVDWTKLESDIIQIVQQIHSSPGK